MLLIFVVHINNINQFLCCEKVIVSGILRDASIVLLVYFCFNANFLMYTIIWNLPKC